MSPDAIPTEYNGVRYRSRLEARWAVFFLTLDIEARYEPAGTEFYTPDFWLPAYEAFIEVKPDDAPLRSLEKVEQLVRRRRKAVYVFEGHQPRLGPFDRCHWFAPHGPHTLPAWPLWDKQTWCECPTCSTVGLIAGGDRGKLRCGCAPGGGGSSRLEVALYTSTRIRF